MKNLSWVETRLRDLRPRGPSPEIKKRIFERSRVVVAEPAVVFSLGDFTRWLAPALACFLVAMASLGTGTPQPYLVGSTNDLLPESNKARYSAYVGSRVFHSEMNSVPVTRVEWNFGARAGSKAESILQLTTNLMR